ncbi:uncharacterized protein LOC120819136 [Gasterosteus aculeatus]
MGERGDGRHSGRNWPQAIVHWVCRGDQLHIAVINFLFNYAQRHRGLAGVLDLNEPEDEDADDNDDEIEDNGDRQGENQEEENHGNIAHEDDNDKTLNHDNGATKGDDGVHVVDSSEDGEVAGCSAWFEVGVKEGDEEDPPPGAPRKSSTEDDREEDLRERPRKDFGESSNGTDGAGFSRETGNGQMKHGEAPLPGPSRRKTNREEDERSNKSRGCDEFSGNDSEEENKTKS